MKKILDELNKYKDKKYASFQAKLIPTVDSKLFIGVRTPNLKTIAKEMAVAFDNKDKSRWIAKDINSFLAELPHKYFDENQLHIFILSQLKDFDTCIKRVNEFLPYIDNWATCDQLSPKVFAKHKDELLKYINKWLKSKKAYTIRFAIGMLMQHYLDDDFDKKYLDMVLKVGAKPTVRAKFTIPSVGAKFTSPNKQCETEKFDININPDKYYIEMMRAWYFATALAKQYDDTIVIIKNYKLPKWTQNKTIQKAKESFRVTDSHKKELKKYIVFDNKTK